MDFSNIVVKLVTLDGVLKGTTECAPNGYYFLPIYDKGRFALQVEGPQGWSFGTYVDSTYIGVAFRFV